MPKGESQLTNVEGVTSAFMKRCRASIHSARFRCLSSTIPWSPLLRGSRIFWIGRVFPLLFLWMTRPATLGLHRLPMIRATRYRRHKYPRTHEQNEELSIASDPEAAKREVHSMNAAGASEDLDIDDGKVYNL